MKCPFDGIAEQIARDLLAEKGQLSAASAGSTAIYSVTMEWETGRRESVTVDAENKDDAMAKAFRKTFGLTNIWVQCLR